MIISSFISISLYRLKVQGKNCRVKVHQCAFYSSFQMSEFTFPKSDCADFFNCFKFCFKAGFQFIPRGGGGGGGGGGLVVAKCYTGNARPTIN